MQQIVSFRTRVSRSVVALVGLPLLVCAMLTVFTVGEIAHIEFNYAIGVSNNKYLPVAANYYRLLHPWGWVGLVLAVVILIALMCRSTCSLGSLIIYGQFVLVFVVSWLAFSGFALYLANGTFWGWRRVIVDREVFADKGSRPGQGPLVPGGDNVLPGELISGKWDNARSVLRGIAGNPSEEGLASEKGDEEVGVSRDEESGEGSRSIGENKGDSHNN